MLGQEAPEKPFAPKPIGTKAGIDAIILTNHDTSCVQCVEVVFSTKISRMYPQLDDSLPLRTAAVCFLRSHSWRLSNHLIKCLVDSHFIELRLSASRLVPYNSCNVQHHRRRLSPSRDSWPLNGLRGDMLTNAWAHIIIAI